MKLSAAIKAIVPLSQAIRDYWDTELPKRHADYPVLDPSAEAVPPPKEEEQLRRFLSELDSDLLHRLRLVMCLGRGDFGTSELEKEYASIRNRLPAPRIAIQQFLSNLVLADYLVEGSAKLRRSGINPDRLFAVAKARG